MALLTRSSNGERKLSAITSHTSAGAVRVRNLVHDVLEMTNLPALTVRGLAAKALVVSLVMKAWRCDGGEIWEHVRYSDKLLASLLRASAEAGVREAGGPVNRTDILFGPREKNARAQALG